MTEEKQLSELTKEELIQKCEELQKESQIFIQQNLDLTYLFSNVMMSCEEYTNKPMFEKNRTLPLKYKIVPNEEFNKYYGLFR